MERNRPGRAAALLLAGLLAACASGRGGDQNTYRGDETGEIVATESNRTLRKKLAIVSPRHKDQGGYMLIQFDLENRSNDQLDFAWAIDWFDGSGFHLDDNQRGWKPVTLGGYGSTTLQAVAPRPEATSWKLQVTARDEVK
jgi:uncharacterized protein YcfL